MTATREFALLRTAAEFADDQIISIEVRGQLEITEMSKVMRPIDIAVLHSEGSAQGRRVGRPFDLQKRLDGSLGLFDFPGERFQQA